MSLSPEQMRKKSLAEAESLRHLRYAQADGMKGESDYASAVKEPKDLDVAMYNQGKGERLI